MLNIFRLKSGTRLQRNDTFFQYSENEQFTGEYWIDGKKIYCKIIGLENSSVGLSYITTIPNMDRLIKTVRTSFSSPSGGNKQVGYGGVFADPTGRVHTNFNESCYKVFLILYYTKTTG